MGKARVGVGLVVGCLFLGGAAPAWAQPTVAAMLAYKPRQEGVNVSTPAEGQHALCKVELVRGKAQGSSGWLLRDPDGKPLRRFFDGDGNKQIDVWSYYKDGVEVYRELDGKGAGKASEFRWLHGGGMKWGVDLNGDGKIDAWRMISAEEVALELFQAVVTQDQARYQALVLSDSDMQVLRLPAKAAEELREQAKKGAAKFQALAAKMPKVSDKTPPRADGSVPQCVPSDVSGGERDLFKCPTVTVMFETADGKHDGMQTGELVQVGLAWRLAGGPTLGFVVPPVPGGGDPPSQEVQKLMEQLAKLDKETPQMPPTPAPQKAVEDHYLARAEIIDQIIAALKDKESERDIWVRQKADNLSTAAMHAAAGSKAALTKLMAFRDEVARQAPGSNLAGYVTFRALWTEYSPKLADAKVQGEWLEKLAGFVQSYPKAEDTPDVLKQLGTGSEFAGKDEEAKRWYQQLASNFPENMHAEHAKGCVCRLSVVGNPMELSGKTANGTAFDITSLKGKVVAVYYWASYCRDLDKEVAVLKEVHGKFGAKGFEVVTVNLDNKTADGMAMMAKVNVTGTHLIQQGVNGDGLSTPLGTHYGILGLPTVFLVGRDGKVISRTLHVNDLEMAVQKGL